jgi:serine/threonine protein kinase
MRQPARVPTRLDETLLKSRFTVGPTLGVGSFGRVVRAHDRVLDRDVAVKLIAVPLDREGSPGTEALLAEARLASAAGPSAIAVHDVLTSDDGIAVVMELIPRGSLLGAVRAGTPEATARQLAVATVASMASVHRSGILHLDLHPGNLLLRQDDTIAVGDFGLARFAYRRGLSRGAHEMIWTAPELLDYRVASKQADVFALGLILRWIGRRAGFSFGSFVEQATAVDRRERPVDAVALLEALRADVTARTGGRT